MSFKKIFVNCNDSKQAEEVISTALIMGYKRLGRSEQLKDVIMDCNGVVFDSFCEPHKKDDFEVLEYQKFMEKYSNKEGVMSKQLMISIIDAAKKQLNVGNSELSLKLGHHRNYISRVLHQDNPTPEQITKVVDKVNALIGEQKLPCGKPLPEFKHTPIADAIMVSKDEYDSLKKELDHKNQVLDKRNAVLENHIERVNELELQLKTTQQKFVDVVDQKDSEIKKLQNDCNHATNQYQGKREQVVQLSEKIKKKENVYMLVIVILLIASTIGFAS